MIISRKLITPIHTTPRSDVSLLSKVQHATSGILASCFLATHNPFAYKMCLYLDLGILFHLPIALTLEGFNLVDLLLMSVSLAIKRDITIYSGKAPSPPYIPL